MIKPFTTTGIGSLPHTNPRQACELVLKSFDIPFWPQLPKLSFYESMLAQFSEGIPFIKIDKKRETIYVERSDALLEFYESYSANEGIAISELYARGLHTFIRFVRNKSVKFLKGQITGPLTFTLALKDLDGRPIYFDEELREISLMVLKAKIRWQIEVLRLYAENIIIFIDEPILSVLGSTSYIGVDADDALRLLQEMSDAIRHAGGIPGIHCCGKADWPLVIKSNVSIISFDAYGYIKTITMYSAEFTDFLKGGGYLAWGIIPTTEAIMEEDSATIRRRFDRGMEELSSSIQSDLLSSQILLTPSCGMGSRSIEETLKVIELLTVLKDSLIGNG